MAYCIECKRPVSANEIQMSELAGFTGIYCTTHLQRILKGRAKFNEENTKRLLNAENNNKDI